MRSSLRLVIGVATLGLVAGCASPPQQDIDAAKAAVEAARQQGAQEYAPDALKAAEDAYADLEAELNAQSEKFTLFRSYKVATAKATATKQAADEAQTAAQTGKELAKQEAAGALQQARTTLQETAAMLETAPRGKGSAADLAMLKADLEGAGATLAEVDGLMAAERYGEAKAKVDAAMTAITGVKSQIEAAQAKVK